MNATGSIAPSRCAVPSAAITASSPCRDRHLPRIGRARFSEIPDFDRRAMPLSKSTLAGLGGASAPVSERSEDDVVGDVQFGRHVPSGLVDNHHRMSAGVDGGADLGEMCLHRLGVAIRHDQPGALALRRADGAEYVGPFGALVVRCPGAGAAPCPAAGDLVLLADARLVLKPDLYLSARGVLGTDLRQEGGEFFLKVSIASGSCA